MVKPRKPSSVDASAAQGMKGCGDAPRSCPRRRTHTHTFLRTAAGGPQRTGELGRHAPGKAPARREPTQGHVWDASSCSQEHVGHMTGWDALSIAMRRNLECNFWVTCRREGPGGHGFRVWKAECDHCLCSRSPAYLAHAGATPPSAPGPQGPLSEELIHLLLPRLKCALSVSVLGVQLLSESRSLSKLSIPETSLMDPPGVTWPLETLNLGQPLCFL